MRPESRDRSGESPPPDDIQPWRLRVELETLGLPPQALPPDPVRGATSLVTGASFGMVSASEVSWEGSVP